MKKFILFKMLGTVVFLVLLSVLAGCTSDTGEDEGVSAGSGVNEGDFDIENNENVLALRDFFRKTFPRGEAYSFDEEMLHYEGVFPTETYRVFQVPDKQFKGECVVINSNEELAAQYKGDVPVPEIDFSKISIILGRAHLPYPLIYQYTGYKIDNDKNETLVTLNFVFKYEDVAYALCAIADYYFYEIVPKFEPGNAVRVQPEYPDLQELFKKYEN